MVSFTYDLWTYYLYTIYTHSTREKLDFCPVPLRLLFQIAHTVVWTCNFLSPNCSNCLYNSEKFYHFICAILFKIGSIRKSMYSTGIHSTENVRSPPHIRVSKMGGNTADPAELVYKNTTPPYVIILHALNR